MRKGRKPITLPAGILILLFTLMPLGGCQQDNGDFQRQLSAADSLMQTDADSAFRMLCTMDSLASRMPKALQMDHLLLRCNAQNKADSLYSRVLYHIGMHHFDSARLCFYKLKKASFELDASKAFMEVYQALRQADSVIAHKNEMACNLVITDYQSCTHHAEKGNVVNQTFNRRKVALWLFGLLALIILIIFVVIFKIRQSFFRSIHSAQPLTTNFYPCKPEQEKPEESESGCNYIQDSEEQLANTPIVEKLRQIRRQDKCTLSDIDWEELHNVFSKFKPRLYNECLCAAHLTKQEFIVCMLICLQFQTSDISILLHTSDQRISNIKKTANRKLFQETTGRSLYKNLCEADSSEGAR